MSESKKEDLEAELNNYFDKPPRKIRFVFATKYRVEEEFREYPLDAVLISSFDSLDEQIEADFDEWVEAQHCAYWEEQAEGGAGDDKA